MPGHNPLMGPNPATAPTTFVGVGPMDSDTMAMHPLRRGQVIDASEMRISRRAGLIVAMAVAVIAAVHFGGFRSTITVGS